MSLRSFHIVFVSICALLSVFLIVWGIYLAPDLSSTSIITIAVGVIGLLLTPIYGVYFLRKAAKLHL